MLNIFSLNQFPMHKIESKRQTLLSLYDFPNLYSPGKSILSIMLNYQNFTLYPGVK